MGNTATKESRQNSPSFGTTVLLSSSRSRTERGSSQTQDRRGSHSSHGHSSSRDHSGHRRSRRADNADYKMIVDRNETVDGGYLFPQGVYQGSQDFKVSVVRDMIIKRRLAPFYRGLDSVESTWSDEELLEAVNHGIADGDEAAEAAEAATATESARDAGALSPLAAPPLPPAPPSPRNSSRRSSAVTLGPPTKTQQIWLYRNVHECPICFLVYPRLNATRCCGQDICTECFVQIKRNPPHPPYTSIENSEATDVLDLISEPSSCPYCAQSDLGVIFEAPPFEWGIPASAGVLTPGSGTPNRFSPAAASPSKSSSGTSSTSQKALSSQRKRRTSIPASHPAVVTVDMIRPDWEDKLASARRRLARKSAVARVLHRSALIPNEDPHAADPSALRPSGSSRRGAGTEDSPRSSPRQPRGSSLADIVEASRSMSAAQTRALERKMIEEAIQASLQ